LRIPDQTSSSRDAARAFLPALLFLLVLAALVGRGFWRFSYDDAFITYRYARSWAAGEGLVYNRGEAVLGTTAPGYALALGILTRAAGGRLDPPAWGTLASLASLVAAFALAGRAAGSSALAALSGALALCLRWNVEMLGTETLPVLALAVAAAYLLLARPPRLATDLAAGLLIALAMAFRLDAALAAAALGVTVWTARRRPPYAFALAGLLPLGGWLAWLLLRFGTVVPNTLAAKRGELGRALHGYTAYEWLWLARTLTPAGAAALLALAALGAALAWRAGLLARPFFRATGLWLLLHEAAYRLLRVPFAPWYEEALLAALVFLAAFAVIAVLSAARAAAGGRRAVLAKPDRIRAAAAALGTLALLALVACPSLAWLARQWGRPPDPRFTVYARAGRYLAAQGGAGEATVAAVEICVLGYVSGLRVLDLAGLVSPEALAAQRAGKLPELVAARRPEFLVDVAAFRKPILGAILARPEIAAGYREAAAFTAPDYGGGAVRIERRRAPP
jgi:hypothetical protein